MLNVALGLFSLWAAYQAYAFRYFRSEKFRSVKQSVSAYVENCNELNAHLEHLKSAYVDVQKVDYGDARLVDTSAYNMRRRRWAEIGDGRRVHNCSAAVVKNANDQPFKYLCKYFNIRPDGSSLADFEKVLNDFAAAEQGKALLVDERSAIVEGIHSSIPTLISAFSRKRVIKELGFHAIDLSSLYFPVYTFQYVSAGGNSSSKCDIQLNVTNLDRFVTYLDGLVKFRKSAAGQRALMTSRLRESIKHRDNFTCRACNLSAHDERNLLLEIDHIVPISRGGMTSVENLQTLCWKCNRAKGAKLVTSNLSAASQPKIVLSSGGQMSQ